ncbi:MAG: class I SAM-dependent methyltransferase, partial [Nitrosopumilus sp.]|nr:class I SAM-dependent methyltransferase [Nitrosopumilus sp.]
QTYSQKKILDIDCGYGTLSFFCQKIFESDIYCIDSNASNLNKALIKEKKIHFKINNIETDDFPWGEKFDIIIFTEVLEHFNFHPVITLKKIHSLLKPTGKLYLSTPDSHEWGRITKYYKKFEDMPNPKKNVEIIDDHIFQFSKEELLKILENAGFNILEFAYSSGVMNRHFNLMLNKK